MGKVEIFRILSDRETNFIDKSHMGYLSNIYIAIIYNQKTYFLINFVEWFINFFGILYKKLMIIKSFCSIEILGLL